MLDAVRAEALKLRRHRATWTMVWLYPIVTLAIVVGALIYTAATSGFGGETTQPAAKWIQNSTLVWMIPTSAPGRFLIAGFAAVVFAGEYGWNTWKLIIPARTRWQLIAAKWAIAIGFVMIALAAADLIGLIGTGIETMLGEPVPEGVTLGALLHAHAMAAIYALLPIGYTVAFAALWAMLTQSILATMILSIAMVVIEGLLLPLTLFFHGYAPGLIEFLVQALPLYHMGNLLAYTHGEPLTLVFGEKGPFSLSWYTSLTALLAWIAAAGAATQLRFVRQDLN